MTDRISRLVLVSVIALGGATACSQDLRPLDKRLDDLGTQVSAMSRKLDTVAAVVSARSPQAAARPPARPQPDPGKAYAVAVDGDPAEGPADAKVTIVKAYDYLCPYCEGSRGELSAIREKYGADVRIVYKQYVVHPQAQLAHLAACAAHRQGKFLEMDALLWDKAYPTRQYSEAQVTELARGAGLDVERFTADMKSDACQQWLDRDRAEMATFGVGATPSFFVNGRYLLGAPPLPAFSALIDEELGKARERIAAGTPAADYYQTWVLAKGEKKLASL